MKLGRASTVFGLALMMLFQGAFGEGKWLDESQSIFVPESLREGIQIPEKFPVFWKGVFLTDAKNAPELKVICEKLSEPSYETYLAEIYCDYRKAKISPTLVRWRDDLPLRQTLPSADEFKASALNGLTLASLPGTPRSLIDILRQDPFQTGQNLLALRSRANLFQWSQGDGVFLSANGAIAFFPVAFNYSPKDFQRTNDFMKSVEKDFPTIFERVEVTGPHAAGARNRNRVTADLSLVSWLGAALLLALMISLGRRNGLRLLVLAIPPLVTVGLTALMTINFFGSIHGLTLSFGPALVGLAVDYGIFASAHRSSRESWRTNRMGMFTTLTGLVILSFSKIPLIRQLMFFAGVGIVLAFATYRVLMAAPWFRVYLDVIPSRRRGARIGAILSGVLLISAVLMWICVPVDLNLRNFEFRTPLQNQLEQTFWSEQGKVFPVFATHEASTQYHIFSNEKRWTDEQGIVADSVIDYLPSPEQQDKNLLTWMGGDCEKNVSLKSKDLSTFYAPFIFRDACNHHPHVYDFENPYRNLESKTAPPVYVAHLFSDDQRTVTFWLARSADEEGKILANYPNAFSVRNIFGAFPVLLAHELAWMFPATLLFCVMLLALHYRRVRRGSKLVAISLALLPLFTAAGSILLVLAIFGYSLSFVSLVGLLMVFGASVDYGIFSVDQIFFGKQKNVGATLTALYLAAFTTFLGYLPLVAARHPVLNNLGIVLSAGVAGAFVGSMWGVPYVARILKISEAA